MLQLDGSRMETVIMPYQPSLVPYRINEQASLLAPPLQYTFVSPSSKLLPTLPVPTEYLQLLLRFPLDLSNDHTSCEKLALAFFCLPLFKLSQQFISPSLSVPALLPLTRQTALLASGRLTSKSWHALMTTMAHLQAPIHLKR